MTRTEAANDKLFQARSATPVGFIYKHKKGGVYVIVGHAIHTDAGDPVVLYRRLYGPNFDPIDEATIVYARPLSEWTQDRFTFLRGNM